MSRSVSCQLRLASASVLMLINKLAVRIITISLATLFLSFSHTMAQQRLVVIGGGTRPAAALAKFIEWAGGNKAHILIIPWATQNPEAAFKSLQEDFAGFPLTGVEAAPLAPLTAATKSKFLEQMKTATGVFFSGGDQGRIMDVLKDEQLLQVLRQRYQKGVVFGGPVPAAIMSRRMITGEVISSRSMARKLRFDRLALLPDHVIIDQHFIRRQRESTLGLILQGKERLGLGIDEGTALLITDNRWSEVVADSKGMLIRGEPDKSLMIRLLNAGDTFDLTSAEVALAGTGSLATNALDARVRNRIAAFKGTVSLFAKNLETGETYGSGADDRVRTASTIKIAVMVEAFARVAAGKAKWTDELVLTKAARYAGSGVLPEIADGLRLTLRDAVNLMMVVSDNTATNMVLDYLSTDAVNARMDSLGFKQIRFCAEWGAAARPRRKGSGQQTLWSRRSDTARMGLAHGTAGARANCQPAKPQKR